MPLSFRVFLALANETAAGALLLNGLGGWGAFLAFLSAHGLAVWFAVQAVLFVLLTDAAARRVLGPSLTLPMLVFCCLPLVGPPGIVLFAVAFRFYPVRALAEEEYEVIDAHLFENLTAEADLLVVMKANPIYAIHNRFTLEEGLTLLKILERLDWFPFKTRVLQIFIEHCTHPSLVLEASRLLQKKRDGLLQRIAGFEAAPEPDAPVLANLYHELYFLDLDGPILGDNYLRKACRLVNDAAGRDEANPALLLAAVKYNLQAGSYDVAEIFLNRARRLARQGTIERSQLLRYEEELRTVRRIEAVKLTRLPGDRADE